MRRKIFKRTVALVLCIASFLAGTVTANAADINSEYHNTQQELGQLEETLVLEQERIAELEEETAALSEESEILNGVVATYQQQLNDLDTQISIVADELAMAEMDYSDEFIIYAMHLREMEEYGTSSYWTILLSSESITDFLNRIDYVMELMAYEENALDQFDAKIKELEEQADHLAVLRSDRNYIAAELKRQQNSLYNTIQSHLKNLHELETLTAEHAAEIEALTERRDELKELLDGYEYTGTQSPAEIYDLYIKQTGEEDRNPKGSAIVKKTLSYLGLPYVWGGSNPETGFDCSGLVNYVYAKFGYTITRVAEYQYKLDGKYVKFSELQAGDLVFFHSPGDKTDISHVGMYICGGLFVHASGKGTGIIVSSLYQTKFQERYAGAKRIVE